MVFIEFQVRAEYFFVSLLFFFFNQLPVEVWNDLRRKTIYGHWM